MGVDANASAAIKPDGIRSFVHFATGAPKATGLNLFVREVGTGPQWQTKARPQDETFLKEIPDRLEQGSVVPLGANGANYLWYAEAIIKKP